MLGLVKTVSIRPHHVGYVYKDNRIYKRLEPGRYHFWIGFSEFSAIAIPTTERLVVITNQEVLTRDNIALRFSYVIRYALTQCDRFVASFNVLQANNAIFLELDQQLHHFSQAHLRQVIAQVESEQLNDQRETLFAELPIAFVTQFAEYGVELRGLILRDLTFPKAIQTLFSRRLEAKIRAQTDLENARTAVATARTLKNAAELMKDNDSIQFLQLLETLTKISASGQHTFVLGDLDRTHSR